MCNAFECLLQFEYFTDCSIREYQSILDAQYSATFAYYASIILQPIMLFIMLAYLTQAQYVCIKIIAFLLY